MERFMNRNIFIIAFLSIILSSGSFAGEPTKAENFTLPDYNGVKHSLTDYKNAKVVVIMFIATQCPVSNAYNTRMVSLDNDYKSKNMVFIGINSNKQESVEEIKQHATDNGFEFTILKDDKNIIADKFVATVTPEIYVVNSSLDILYHGRIDDSRRESDAASQDLRNALDEILAGKHVSVSETKAFGCTIKRVE
jgi:peroxiredoxin